MANLWNWQGSGKTEVFLRHHHGLTVAIMSQEQSLSPRRIVINIRLMNPWHDCGFFKLFLWLVSGLTVAVLWQK